MWAQISSSSTRYPRSPRGAAAKARSMRESGAGMDHHHHPEMSGGGGAAERDNMTDVEITICRGM